MAKRLTSYTASNWQTEFDYRQSCSIVQVLNHYTILPLTDYVRTIIFIKYRKIYKKLATLVAFREENLRPESLK